MTNKKKVTLSIVIIAVIVACVGGMVFFKSTEDTFKDELKARYGEDVEFVELDKKSSNEATRKATLKGKYGEFTCTKYFDLEGNVHFSDNYLGVKYEDDIQQLLEEIVSDKGEVSVDISTSIFSDFDDPSKVSVEGLLSAPTTYITTNIQSKDSWDDEKVNELADELKGKVKVNCTISWDSGSYYFSVTPSGDAVDTSLQEK